ncbi:hydroxyacid dehydrogenase [Sinomonas sp. JGH33]|uniref:Hydroxyacid dehydrogenase n=1 Tax=Sinomonas terricola TaxID=3110330 RepID=A0ABU5T6D4_9MICC|nr:hydroxyacid dehydrogenase [Sinomonas sp. JGH33]MEA5455236.1 hydroxyacid dehydrogenase [Sinomonas sp. JGH33]
MPGVKAVFAMAPEMVPFIFGESEIRRLRELVELDPQRILAWEEGREPELGSLADVELLLSGWGAPFLGAPQLDRLPALRAVVHWGGGIGFLDQSARERGIEVSSARAANGIPVAEFTVAMITLAAKDALWVSRQYCREQRHIDREAELPHTGLYGTTVGLVGASTIGMLVIEQLRDRDVEVLVYDPYLTEAAASSLRVEIVRDLEDLARRSTVLSLHAPVTPQTEGMITRRVLAALPDGAILVNTARGILVDQDALVEELAANRIRAILDVTEPEVLPEGHPLYSLPNVFLTPHLAGSTGVELRRLGHAALAEVERYVAGVPFAHPFPFPDPST